MQNNQIAAAADRTPAAAVTMFQSLCDLANRAHWQSSAFSIAEVKEADNLRSFALARISEAAGQQLTFSDICGIYSLQSQRQALRIFRKAAAFEITGLGDFFAYLKFAYRASAYRASICGDYLNETDFTERNFFEFPRQCGAANYGLQPLVSTFYSYDKYRLALNGSGKPAPYHKNDTFFCPLAKDFCGDSQRTRVYTSDRALYDAAVIYGNGRIVNGHHYNLTDDFYEVGMSDFALASREGVYIDYYRAYILDAEYGFFEVAQMVETGNFCHISEGHFWADYSFHQFPEGQVCQPDDAVASYHASARGGLTNQPVRFSRNAPYLAGFEVEKEDIGVKCSLTIGDFQRQLPNFRKERDGSLDDRAGFEFISPPLELSPRNIRAYFEARPVALAHINAGFSTRCGGHIHISRRGYSGPDLFRMISGHLPLLHALFPARADGSNSRWSAAMSAADMLRNRQKYQSINILPDRIEIRIFGAVRGLDNLIWRAGLVLKLFKHAASTPAEGYEKLPRLFSHLRKVYATPAEMEMLIKRVEKYARKFEAYRPYFGQDAAGRIENATRFKTYRPATKTRAVRDAAGNFFLQPA